jgi:hypothetical protein
LSNEHPKFGHEIFLDRTHGKRMSEMLRRVGFTVHHIYDVYPGTAHESVDDPVWIQLCGEKGWIAISGDKRLETVPENRQAVINARLKVFVLTDSNSKPEVWAAAVIVGHFKMAEIIDGNDGPFFVNISKRSDGHVAKLRLPPGYTPAEESTETLAIGDGGPILQLTSPDDQEG